MQLTQEIITPEIAKQYLLLNINNNRALQRAVRRYLDAGHSEEVM